MNQQYVKDILLKRSSYETALTNQQYVDDRRTGKIKSLRTKFKKLDSALLGGIELDTILCIGALSGAGKSTLSKCIRDSIHDLNKDLKFNQYIFNFEMIAHQQVARSIVSEADIALRDLYSIDEPLSDIDFAKLKTYYEKMKNREDLFFIDQVGTAAQIKNSLLYYYYEECKPYSKILVYEIDHALLTKGATGESEKKRVDELMYNLVQVKKEIANDGGHSVGIVLSQMNREIKDKDRIRNKELHRPSTDCLFGSSAIEMCCDYIMISHIPAKLGINAYTTRNLPTLMLWPERSEKTYQIVYFELIKQRSGESDLTFPMLNKLDRFNFDEMPTEHFNKLYKQFSENKKCVYKSNM